MITVLIKAFKRPEAVKRLLESINKFRPYTKVYLLEDEDDIGLSAGRNRLVEVCETPYCLILDDDCLFNEKTDLDKAIEILKEKDLDILQLKVPGIEYHGLFQTNGDTVKYVAGDRDGLYDFCANIFVAKTDSLRKYKWDEDLKMGEHFAYFYDHKGKMRIGITDEVEIEHHHVDAPGYAEYRYRAKDYVKKYMLKKGIKKRIELYGEQTTV